MRFLLCTAVVGAVFLTSTTAHAVLVEGSFAGSVTDFHANVPPLPFPIALGDILTGKFRYDTNDAVIDPVRPTFSFYEFPAGGPNNFFDITLNGNTWSTGPGWRMSVSNDEGLGDLWSIRLSDGAPSSYPGSFGFDIAIISFGDRLQTLTFDILSSTALPTSLSDLNFSTVGAACCGGQISSDNGIVGWTFDFSIDPNSLRLGMVQVPAPTPLALFGVGLPGLLGLRRRLYHAG